MPDPFRTLEAVRKFDTVTEIRFREKKGLVMPKEVLIQPPSFYFRQFIPKGLEYKSRAPFYNNMPEYRRFDDLWVSINAPYVPANRTRDQNAAEDYNKEVWKLTMSNAGTRAWDLLFEHLNEYQQEQVKKHFYFDVLYLKLEKGKYSAYDEAVFRARLWHLLQRDHWNQPLSMDVAVFRFHCWYPNGNIWFNDFGSESGVVNYCIHPPEPYPMGDILLTQKMLLENEPERFFDQANPSRRPEEGLAETPEII